MSPVLAYIEKGEYKDQDISWLNKKLTEDFKIYSIDKSDDNYYFLDDLNN